MQAKVFLPANAPAPLPLKLQQKYVVAVKVGADATTLGGIADHQVIKPTVWRKAKSLQQLMGRLLMSVYTLNQQSPTGSLQRRQGTPGKRPLPEPPAPGLLAYQARLHIVLACQGEQFGRAEKGAPPG